MTKMLFSLSTNTVPLCIIMKCYQDYSPSILIHRDMMIITIIIIIIIIIIICVIFSVVAVRGSSSVPVRRAASSLGHAWSGCPAPLGRRTAAFCSGPPGRRIGSVSATLPHPGSRSESTLHITCTHTPQMHAHSPNTCTHTHTKCTHTPK